MTNPNQGGSYVMQKNGKAKRMEFTKSASGRPEKPVADKNSAATDTPPKEK